MVVIGNGAAALPATVLPLAVAYTFHSSLADFWK